MSTSTETIEELATREYKYGFVTEVESETIPKGLSEDVVRLISQKKDEPEWLLEWRLKAYRLWLTMKEPTWQNVKYDPINYQDIVYYSAPKKKKVLNSLDEVDPEVRATFNKLGIPIEEQMLLAGVAVDAVFDSVSVATTFREKLAKHGHHLHVVLGRGARASRAREEVSRLGRAAHRQLLRRAQLGGVQRRLVRLHPEGRPLPDGAVDLLPHQREGHRAVRADADHRRRGLVRQLPRRLHGADARREPAARRGRRARGARRRDDQVLDDPELVSRRQGRQGRHLQLRDQARPVRGRGSKITWTQVETGSAITWKYPSCILQGDNSIGEFYSVATTNNWQQADTGTKMIHLGKNTRSTIVSKGISAGHGQNTYRGLVRDRQEREERAQLLAVRLAAHRRQVRRAHVPVPRDPQHLRAGSSTRRRRRRSARTRSSTAGSAA